ncbi:hypothetical protein ABAC460_07520 [Asticcacaulis sp. AC460]|nr:hypothetical protein ABAC460_07520 [Asticcacaulis sp. AC460]
MVPDAAYFKAMAYTISPLNPAEQRPYIELLCDGYFVEGLRSVRTLVDLLREKAPLHPGKRLFATLDNYGQAAYTSGHSTDEHELNDTDGYDLSGLDPAAFEDGEHRGYLTTKSEFFIRHGNMAKSAADRSFEQVHLSYGEGEDGLDFFGLNGETDILDEERLFIQAVPVEHAWEAISAFPNGYFSADLQPQDIWAMAKRFETRYGYCLFGIGAAYVGFLRTQVLSEALVASFTADVLSMFDLVDPFFEAPRVADLIRRSDYLLFNYTNG